MVRLIFGMFLLSVLVVIVRLCMLESLFWLEVMLLVVKCLMCLIEVMFLCIVR